MLWRRYNPLVTPSAVVSFGDWAPMLFLIVLVSAPTLLLVRKFAKSETACTKYAKVLFYLSLTGPLSVALIAALQGIGNFNLVFLPRVMVSPIVLLVMIVSWLSASFGRAK